MTDSSIIQFELGYNVNGGDCKAILIWNGSDYLK